MRDGRYIKLAIDEAKKSEKSGGKPIGAVMVRNGEVVAKGLSLVLPKKDPSAHAEIECIRNACKNLQTLDLSGCTLYSTLESCSMCLACAVRSGISRIVFGAYKEDLKDNPYEFADYHAKEHAKKLTTPKGEKVKVIGGVLRQQCKELTSNIQNWLPV